MTCCLTLAVRILDKTAFRRISSLQSNPADVQHDTCAKFLEALDCRPFFCLNPPLRQVSTQTKHRCPDILSTKGLNPVRPCFREHSIRHYFKCDV
ncbi:hypothetical protein BaRGS_00020037 [Batillaria attramentaria]|uniref:Uncharacterized protein n=1 Tax=Batillaria attramentaria TaxID=370345 RepID=A0ABD0KPL0_9CAEN